MIFDTIYILAIVSNALNVVWGVINAAEEGNFYGYMIGQNATAFISRTFVLIDKATSLYLLTPIKPWIRYKK